MESGLLHTYLITAMLTGAVVLARYTVVSDIFDGSRFSYQVDLVLVRNLIK